MDIARPLDRTRQHRRRITAAAAVVMVAALGAWLWQVQAATPVLERSNLWVGAVERGAMVRQVRGAGTLVPEDVRWIPATTMGRVDRIVLRQGARVESGSIILELSNPTLRQELEESVIRVKAAEASLASIRAQLGDETLVQQGVVSGINADYRKAALQADVNRKLSDKGLISTLVVEQATLDAQQLAERLALAHQQLDRRNEASTARLAVQQAELERARAVLALRQRQVDDLRVRAGVPGVLQTVAIEVGQQVAPGTNLAVVVDPARLKAELRIAETQARDVQLGQRVSIDTRNGLASGTIARIDPAVQNGTVTVDVEMSGALPAGARPDLTVDGTIELERLPDVLHIGRPAFVQEQGTVNLFRVRPNGDAARVQVVLGRGSVDRVEVRSGLQAGDVVILSDMSAWNTFDRVRVK